MPEWVVVENTEAKSVRLVNLANVSDIEISEYHDNWTGTDEIRAELYYGDEVAGSFNLADWSEVEKFINILPGIDQLGWILIRDGKVDNWRGRLAVKDVKELAEEEENEILEGVGDE